MKLLVIGTLIALTTSCGSVKFSQKMDECITRYLQEGLDHKGALEVCRTIFKPRESRLDR